MARSHGGYPHVSLYNIQMCWWFVLLVIFIPYHAHSQTCTTGSLELSSTNTAAPRNRTYLLPEYEVTCNGTVHSWQYCYLQVLTTTTIYPSIWRLINSSDTYMMIGVNEVTIPAGGQRYLVHNISGDQQFSVQTGDIIGVFTNDVLLYESNNHSVITHLYQNNQSGIVTLDGRTTFEFNIAIEVSVVPNTDPPTTTSTSTVMVGTSTTTIIEQHLSTSTIVVQNSIEQSITGVIERSSTVITIPSSIISGSTSTITGQSSISMTVPISTSFDSGSGSSSSTGAIVGGIVVAVVCIAIIIVFVLIMYYLRRMEMITCCQQVKHTSRVDSMQDDGVVPRSIKLLDLVNENAYISVGDANKSTAKPSQYTLPYAAPIDATSPVYEQPLKTRSIYVDPGYQQEKLYAWFETKDVYKIEATSIKILEKIGSGHFGVVHLGTWTDGSADPIQVAVKTLNSKCSVSDRVKFLREAAIMGQFQHNNVVQLHGVVTEEENMMIVLEYMTRGDLKRILSVIKSNKDYLESSQLPDNLLNFCRQISAGLNYLANKHFVHRDLAARNILVSSDDVCKIADFGMARDVEDDPYYHMSGGQLPIKWSAPEAIFYKKYSTQSDVWSFGCVMYEIWSLGHVPFESISKKQVLNIIKTGYRLPPPPGCPRTIYELMLQCWHPESKDRPQPTQVLNTLQSLNKSQLQADDGTRVGAVLSTGEHQYTDLQKLYMK